MVGMMTMGLWELYQCCLDKCRCRNGKNVYMWPLAQWMMKASPLELLAHPVHGQLSYEFVLLMCCENIYLWLVLILCQQKLPGTVPIQVAVLADDCGNLLDTFLLPIHTLLWAIYIWSGWMFLGNDTPVRKNCNPLKTKYAVTGAVHLVKALGAIASLKDRTWHSYTSSARPKQK